MMKFQTLLIVGAVAGIGVNGVSGNDYSIPPFPPEPSMEALLDANGLAQASEEELANYVSRNASAIESWIPAITSREESTVGGTYIGLLDKGDPNAKTYWQKKTTEMTEQRLHDPRRIVDAALRRLGQVGTPRCFDSLIGFCLARTS